MKKSLSVAAATLLLALATTPAMAAHGGSWGLGTLYSSFPIGAFIGINDKTTVHFGIDIEAPDGGDVDDGDPKLTFGVGGALEYDIWGGDNWGFGVFPAVAFSTTSYEDIGTTSVDSSSEVLIGANLGGHFDPVSNVSIYFTHGLEIDISSPPVGDSTTDIATFGDTVGNLGVSFWFD